MTDGWTLAAEARITFADLCDTLTPEQANGATWCAGWTPHLIAAHVATFIEVPLPKFMFTIAKNKGNFDVASDVMARQLAERPMSDLTAAIRSKASKTAPLPMFPCELTLADTLVHTEDIRRGLDLPGEPSQALVRASLEFLTTSKKAMPLLETKGLLDGLRFEATDSDWSHGDGELVSGKGIDLLLAITRRPVDDALTGDGVSILRGRHSS